MVRQALSKRAAVFRPGTQEGDKPLTCLMRDAVLMREGSFSDARLGGIMDASHLLAEGVRLARPSLVLSASSGRHPCVGLWGGPGIVPAPPGDWKHWITVDCDWLFRHKVPL